MSIGTAPPPPVEVAAPRTESAASPETADALSRREATLRSAATACLAGIALILALELPSLIAQGGQFAVLSLAATALCIGLGLALAIASASASPHLWSVIAATAVLLLAGWAASRAFAVPGVAHHRGHWVGMPGALCGALAAVCLALAAAGAPPRRAAARGLVTAVAVLVAFAPGAGVLLVALGPGPSGGETALASGVHLHARAGLDETRIRFQRIPGGRGGHYVYRTTATPRHTPLGAALLVAAALLFGGGAVDHLRRRSTRPVPAGR